MKKYGVPRSTLHNWTRNGVLPIYGRLGTRSAPGGGPILIKVGDLINAQEHPPLMGRPPKTADTA